MKLHSVIEKIFHNLDKLSRFNGIIWSICLCFASYLSDNQSTISLHEEKLHTLLLLVYYGKSFETFDKEVQNIIIKHSN